jgi:hypothetical protein
MASDEGYSRVGYVRASMAAAGTLLGLLALGYVKGGPAAVAAGAALLLL